MGLLVVLALGFPGQDAVSPPPPQAEAEANRLADPGPVRIGARARGSRRLAERPESGPNLVGFLVWTTVVVGLLLGTFMLLRRFGRNSRFLAGGGVIQVLARRSVGVRQELILVEVGPRLLVVGSSREGMRTLGEFNNPDEVAQVRAALPGRKGDSAPEAFRESLREGLREAEKPAAGGELVESITGELDDLRKTVKGWRA